MLLSAIVNTQLQAGVSDTHYKPEVTSGLGARGRAASRISGKWSTPAHREEILPRAAKECPGASSPVPDFGPTKIELQLSMTLIVAKSSVDA